MVMERCSDEDMKALREHVAAQLTAIAGMMTAMSEVRIVGGHRTFKTPPAPWIDEQYFSGLAEELSDPDLPVDRLLTHALGLEDGLRKLRVAAVLWLGQVVGEADGLDRRPDRAATVAAMGTTTVVTLASRADTVETQVSTDPGVLRALTLVAPHGPDGMPCFHGSERAA